MIEIGPAVAGEHQERDVVYLRSGGIDRSATLYVPSGSGPFPAVVDVHGGTWVGGDRFSDATLAAHLADHGVSVLSIDFRMPPAARYPDPVADVNAAIRWLKQHHRQARTRPEAVGGIGFSSGGHQIMLNALRPEDARYRGEPIEDDQGYDARLAFVISCWGVLDPLGRYRMAQAQGLRSLLDGHDAYWPSEAPMDEGSPLAILNRGEPAEMPPALVLQGDADANLGPDMAERFGAAYRSRGGLVEVVTYAGAPHGFIRKNPDSSAAHQATARIVDFARRHGRA
ncbi:MAG TPA: alpha/beta hydrolase [Micromonosporaceae bacterium]|jgi:acetyl esterase/lipase